MAIGARKQVELGISGVLLFVKSFNVVAIGVRRQEELKWELEGKFPSPPSFFFFVMKKTTTTPSLCHHRLLLLLCRCKK